MTESPPSSISALFPPPPRGLKGRAGELRTLARTVLATAPTRLALIGTGGSGKSMLACALGHKMSRRFRGRLHWFRVGAWDFHTLVEMLSLGFGVTGAARGSVSTLRNAISRGGERLIVLDNHEDDRAMARLLDELAGTPATFVITARRCLLAGVLIFPVTAPLVTSGRSAFPRVARLTRMLRWNPLALDVADAIVRSGGATVGALSDFLERKGVSKVQVISHEDDLPEVALLVAWAWQRLGASSRRLLGVLAHLEGDHVDKGSLATLARVSHLEEALLPLKQWHLVQEPMRERFALHAVVRHAILGRSAFDPKNSFEHYVSLLEEHPARMMWEQTHLFAAMDYAHRTGDLARMLRIERLLAQIKGEAPPP